jgi:steroid delta-isomerase-like uncharacterized protein
VETDQLKNVMRRYYEEAWNGRDTALLGDLLAADYVNRSPFVPDLPTGPEGVPLVMHALWTAFPDLSVAVDDLVAEGDRVASRTTLRGTHQGALFGAPPTGRTVEVAMMSIERIAGGRIAEHWRVSDELGLLRQLGMAPMPAH